MYATHILIYSGVEISKNNLIYHFRIDKQQFQVIMRLSEKPAFPNQIIYPIIIDIGMTILTDFAQIIIPKEIIINLPYSRKKLSFWMEWFKKMSIEKAYFEKLNPDILEFPWKIINCLETKKFELKKKKDKIFLAQSCGKESFTALYILEKKFPLKLFFLEPDENIYKKQTFAILSSSYHVFSVTTNLMDLYNKFQIKFKSRFYSRFQTGLIVLLSLLYADQSPYILLGNEYSANFGNGIYLGKAVNHQFQKSVEFAVHLNTYIDTFLTEDFDYYSPFFSLYEYAILKLFMKKMKIYNLWSSCNNADGNRNFCGKCYKCAFIYILALEHTSKKFLSGLFPYNLMENLELLKPLIDPHSQKVLDCVGEKKEAWVALNNISLLKKDTDSRAITYFNTKIFPVIKKDLPKYLYEVNHLQKVPLAIPQSLEKIIRKSFEPNS